MLTLRTCRVSLLLAVLCTGALSAQAVHVPIDLVVERLGPVPGMPGVVFSTLHQPVINGRGEIAFKPLIAGPGIDVFNDDTLWADPPDDLQLIAREGAEPFPVAEPGTTFVSLGFVSDVPIMASTTGKLAFVGALLSGGTDAVFEYDLDTQTLDTVIRDDDPVPGLSGVTFSSFSTWAYDDAGIAVVAIIEGPGISFLNDDGIWTGTPAGLDELMRIGSEAPGYPGSTITSFTIDAGKSFGTNPSGATVFLANVDNPPLIPDVWVIYAGVPGNLVRIAAQELQAPAPFGPGCEFNTTAQGANTSARAIGASGAVTFFSTVECDPGDIRSALFQGGPAGPGAVQTVATTTELVGPGGDTWSSFLEYRVGGGDMLAVRGFLSGDQAVYGGTAGSLSLFARQSDPAPGTTESFDDLDPPQIDGSGRIVLTASLAPSARRGIWAGTPGDVELVAIGGHTVGSGATRRTLDPASGPYSFGQVSAFGTGNADGLPSNISDNGQIVFRSEAAPDGGSNVTAIFITRDPADAVPIPALALWLLAAAPAATALRRRPLRSAP